MRHDRSSSIVLLGEAAGQFAGRRVMAVEGNKQAAFDKLRNRVVHEVRSLGEYYLLDFWEEIASLYQQMLRWNSFVRLVLSQQPLQIKPADDGIMIRRQMPAIRHRKRQFHRHLVVESISVNISRRPADATLKQRW